MEITNRINELQNQLENFDSMLDQNEIENYFKTMLEDESISIDQKQELMEQFYNLSISLQNLADYLSTNYRAN